MSLLNESGDQKPLSVSCGCSFAGSNTTGQLAETGRRRWVAFELSREYVGGSAFRFLNKQSSPIEVLGEQNVQAAKDRSDNERCVSDL
ncbi:MAG: hypothetical protein ABSG03_22505 [Bryobacteraceae bacterium]|jgi:DNA modification methylase